MAKKSKLEKCVEEINEQIEEFQENAEKQVESGNNAAGRRARKASSSLTKLCKEFRKLSNEAKNK